MAALLIGDFHQRKNSITNVMMCALFNGVRANKKIVNANKPVTSDSLPVKSFGNVCLK